MCTIKWYPRLKLWKDTVRFSSRFSSFFNPDTLEGRICGAQFIKKYPNGLIVVNTGEGYRNTIFSSAYGGRRLRHFLQLIIKLYPEVYNKLVFVQTERGLQELAVADLVELTEDRIRYWTKKYYASRTRGEYYKDNIDLLKKSLIELELCNEPENLGTELCRKHLIGVYINSSNEFILGGDNM